MEQTILSKNFLDKFGPDICKTLIRRWIFDDSDEIEIMLHVTDLPQNFGMYQVVFLNSNVFSWIRGVLIQQKSYQKHTLGGSVTKQLSYSVVFKMYYLGMVK